MFKNSCIKRWGQQRRRELGLADLRISIHFGVGENHAAQGQQRVVQYIHAHIVMYIVNMYVAFCVGLFKCVFNYRFLNNFVVVVIIVVSLFTFAR